MSSLFMVAFAAFILILIVLPGGRVRIGKQNETDTRYQAQEENPDIGSVFHKMPVSLI